MKPIWIVDDDQSIRFVLEGAGARGARRAQLHPTRATFSPRWKTTSHQVLGQRHPHARRLGHRAAGKVKERHPGLPVIIMTAYSDLDSAVGAFQGGAFEYLPKPFDVPGRWS